MQRPQPQVVSESDWKTALERLRADEKQATCARDTSFVLVSRAPSTRIEAYRKRMGRDEY